MALEVTTASGDTHRHVGFNASVGGVAADATEGLDDATKRMLGPFAFAVAGVDALRRVETVEAEITTPDGTSRHTLAAFAICNGRTAGGGRQLAPEANPSDGLLDLVGLRARTTGELAQALVSFALTTHHDHDAYLRETHATIELTLADGRPVNLDGDLLASDVVQLLATCLPGSLDMLVPSPADLAP